MPELDAYRAPRLEWRAPTTSVVDEWEAQRLIEESIQPTGVHEPTVLVLNLEGRPATPAGAVRLIVDLGRHVKSGAWGPLVVILASTDTNLKAVAAALAQANDLPLFWTSSVRRVFDAEPLTRLTPAEQETLEALRRRGGRATVGILADAIGTDHTAAGNRVSNLDRRHLVFRVDRPRPSGHVYLDPRIADPRMVSAAEEIDTASDPSTLQSDLATLVSMQTSASPEDLASAWREFLDKHRDELSRTHDRAREAISSGNTDGAASLARRHARTKARGRASRRPG